MDTKKPDDTNEMESENDKQTSSNIQIILDKLKTLPISNEDKSLLMNQFKQNILNPSKNENKTLEDIHNKYLGSNPMQAQDTNYINQLPIQLQSQFIPQMQQKMPMQLYNPYSQQTMYQGELMTTAHFEILKNKIDTVQYELIDLLRHVKDYTQRYMNSVRQQDLAKIDEYIQGLFDVDKTLKETKDKIETETTPPEEEAATEENVISKATNGITNFMGNMGESVSGITKLVKSTADVANGYLSKKIISSPKDETAKGKEEEKEVSTNTNIVSIDEYINENEKKKTTGEIKSNDSKEEDKKEGEEEVTNEKEDEEVTNEKEDEEEGTDEKEDKEEGNEEVTNEKEDEEVTNEKEDEEVNEEGTQENKDGNEEGNEEVNEEGTQENEEGTQENKEENEEDKEDDNNEEEKNKKSTEKQTPSNLSSALTELNDKINKNDNKIQKGGSYKTLKNKIQILKLKLTKKKLQKELYKKSSNNNNKNKKTKHKFKKTIQKKLSKHK
jgi:hypothetical protein